MRARRLVTLIVLSLAHPLAAGAQGRAAGPLREAAELDRAGRTAAARALIQGVLDTASDPSVKANAHRTMAMSYAFDGDCANTLKHHRLVIDYWKTREQAEPQNAFYQQGEMANEGARVCIDAGSLEAAERWYAEGYALGMKEPAPRTHPASLWDFRLAHARARVAARRGDAAEARRQVAAARRALDSDTAMAAQQERFFPYLTGYVALYTNDLATAQREFERALAMRGNEREPFVTTLLAMTYEKQGRTADAEALYRKAFDLARSHNPPAAYVRRVVREKLGASLPEDR